MHVRLFVVALAFLVTFSAVHADSAEGPLQTLITQMLGDFTQVPVELQIKSDVLMTLQQAVAKLYPDGAKYVHFLQTGVIIPFPQELLGYVTMYQEMLPFTVTVVSAENKLASSISGFDVESISETTSLLYLLTSPLEDFSVNGIDTFPAQGSDGTQWIAACPTEKLAECALSLAESSHVIHVDIAAGIKVDNRFSRHFMQGSSDYDGSAVFGIYSKGYNGSGEIVAFSDAGCVTNHTFFHDPSNPVPYDDPSDSHRKIHNYVTTFTNMSADQDKTHGTHVAGTIAGLPLNESLLKDSGIAPGARLVIIEVGLSTFTDVSAYGLQKSAYENGARIHSMSWTRVDTISSQLSLGYSVTDYEIDKFLYEHPEMLALTSAGNTGPGTGTVLSPGLARNILTVGATGSTSEICSEASVQYSTCEIDTSSFYSSLCSLSNQMNAMLNDSDLCEPLLENMNVTYANGSCADLFARRCVEVNTMTVQEIYSAFCPLEFSDPSYASQWYCPCTTAWVYKQYFSDNYCNPDSIAMYSSSDSANLKPEIAATGSVISADASDPNGLRVMTGTSMSTPLTAGQAAIVRQILKEEFSIANPTGYLVRASLIALAQTTVEATWSSSAYQIRQFDTFFNGALPIDRFSISTTSSTRYFRVDSGASYRVVIDFYDVPVLPRPGVTAAQVASSVTVGIVGLNDTTSFTVENVRSFFTLSNNLTHSIEIGMDFTLVSSKIDANNIAVVFMPLAESTGNITEIEDPTNITCNECVHGICNGNTGSCVCDTGYQGDQCDQYTYANCTEFNDCSGNGVCTLYSSYSENSYCECYPLYSGDNCTESVFTPLRLSANFSDTDNAYVWQTVYSTSIFQMTTPLSFNVSARNQIMVDGVSQGGLLLIPNNTDALTILADVMRSPYFVDFKSFYEQFGTDAASWPRRVIAGQTVIYIDAEISEFMATYQNEPFYLCVLPLNFTDDSYINVTTYSSDSDSCGGVCTTTGVCVDDTCSCVEALQSYTGDTCTDYLCFKNCSGHPCVDGVCQCENGYGGLFCEDIPACEANCVNGACVNNTCICDSAEYIGPYCNIYVDTVVYSNESISHSLAKESILDIFSKNISMSEIDPYDMIPTIPFHIVLDTDIGENETLLVQFESVNPSGTIWGLPTFRSMATQGPPPLTLSYAQPVKIPATIPAITAKIMQLQMLINDPEQLQEQILALLDPQILGDYTTLQSFAMEKNAVFSIGEYTDWILGDQSLSSSKLAMKGPIPNGTDLYFLLQSTNPYVTLNVTANVSVVSEYCNFDEPSVYDICDPDTLEISQITSPSITISNIEDLNFTTTIYPVSLVSKQVNWTIAVPPESGYLLLAPVLTFQLPEENSSPVSPYVTNSACDSCQTNDSCWNETCKEELCGYMTQYDDRWDACDISYMCWNVTSEDNLWISCQEEICAAINETDARYSSCSSTSCDGVVFGDDLWSYCRDELCPSILETDSTYAPCAGPFTATVLANMNMMRQMMLSYPQLSTGDPSILSTAHSFSSYSTFEFSMRNLDMGLPMTLSMTHRIISEDDYTACQDSGGSWAGLSCVCPLMKPRVSGEDYCGDLDFNYATPENVSVNITDNQYILFDMRDFSDGDQGYINFEMNMFSSTGGLQYGGFDLPVPLMITGMWFLKSGGSSDYVRTGINREFTVVNPLVPIASPVSFRFIMDLSDSDLAAIIFEFGTFGASSLGFGVTPTISATPYITRTCPLMCFGTGICNTEKHTCDCYSGYQGSSCLEWKPENFTQTSTGHQTSMEVTQGVAQPAMATYTVPDVVDENGIAFFFSQDIEGDPDTYIVPIYSNRSFSGPFVPNASVDTIGTPLNMANCGANARSCALQVTNLVAGETGHMFIYAFASSMVPDLPLTNGDDNDYAMPYDIPTRYDPQELLNMLLYYSSSGGSPRTIDIFTIKMTGCSDCGHGDCLFSTCVCHSGWGPDTVCDTIDTTMVTEIDIDDPVTEWTMTSKTELFYIAFNSETRPGDYVVNISVPNNPSFVAIIMPNRPPTVESFLAVATEGLPIAPVPTITGTVAITIPEEIISAETYYFIGVYLLMSNFPTQVSADVTISSHLPYMTIARFSDDSSVITVSFSSRTDMAGFSALESHSCDGYFTDTVNTALAAKACIWTDAKTLNIRLSSATDVVASFILQLNYTSEESNYCISDARGTVDGCITGTRPVLPPSTPDDPSVKPVVPDVVPACESLSFRIDETADITGVYYYEYSSPNETINYWLKGDLVSLYNLSHPSDNISEIAFPSDEICELYPSISASVLETRWTSQVAYYTWSQYQIRFLNKTWYIPTPKPSLPSDIFKTINAFDFPDALIETVRGENIVINVIVTNQFGSTYNQTYTILVSDQQLPQLQFLGTGDKIVSATTDTVVPVSTGFSACGGKQSIEFVWKVSEDVDSSIRSRVVRAVQGKTTPSLTIPAGLLTCGETADIYLEAKFSGSSESSKLTVTLRGAMQPLTASLTTGEYLKVSKSDGVTIDGSSSVDPCGNDVSYSWTCVSQPDTLCSAITLSGEPILDIPSDDLDVGTFTFTLTVVEGSRTKEISTTIEVATGVVIPAQIVMDDNLFLPSASRKILYATTGSLSVRPTYTWSCEGIDLEDQSLTGANKAYLALKKGSMGTLESTTCTVTISATGYETGSASVKIYVPANPSFGTLSVTPTTGTVFQTAFNISTVDCAAQEPDDAIDFDSSLTYLLYTQSCDDCQLIPAGAASFTGNWTSIYLPLGNTDNEYKLNVVVVIVDSYGARSSDKIVVTVNQDQGMLDGDDSDMVDTIEAQLAEAKMAGDSAAQLAVLKASADIMKEKTLVLSSTETIAELVEKVTERRNAKARLVSEVVSSINSISNSSSAEEISASIETVKSFAEQPEELDLDTKKSLLSAVKQMTQQLIGSADEPGTAARDLLESAASIFRQTQNASQMALEADFDDSSNTTVIDGTIVEKVDSSDIKEMAEELRDTLKELAGSLLAVKVCGEEPDTFSTPEIEMHMTKQSVDDFGNFTVGNSTMELSDAAKTVISAQSACAGLQATTQTDDFTDASALFDSMASTEERTGSVVSFSFRDEDGVDISVSNIGTPILITIPTASLLTDAAGVCRYYNTETGLWSDVGLTFNTSYIDDNGQAYVVCATTHLTEFSTIGLKPTTNPSGNTPIIIAVIVIVVLLGLTVGGVLFIRSRNDLDDELDFNLNPMQSHKSFKRLPVDADVTV